MSADWYPGIRAFCAHWNYAPMLQQTFQTLETEFRNGTDGCIDAAKAIVECACQVVIKNLDDPENPIKEWPDSPIKGNHPSFNNWVTAAVRLLNTSEGRDDPFNKVISQHYKLTNELGKFRDIAGPLSHGKEGFSLKLSVHHQRSAVLAADAIVTFLHQAYLEHKLDPAVSLEPYERFSQSNEVIDNFSVIEATADEDGVLIATVRLPSGDEIPITVEPSRLLFGVDREGYKMALTACREAEEGGIPDTDSEETS